MIGPPERSPERDAAIKALLPIVPFQGWTRSALRAALKDIGEYPDDADLLFPRGAADMVEAYFDWADRRMEDGAAKLNLAAMRVPERVRAVMALRLQQNRPYKEAVRRAYSLLMLPQNTAVAAACTARTVDAIWHAAGDKAADFSWYTKRAILAGIYSATMLYWLSDQSEEDADTLAFLDRRLAEVGRFGRMRHRVEDWIRRITPPPLRGAS
ncbi:MAG: COQ9 family protein [Acetobacteraceae bacterium]|nr:COQ9 family protein [Acetobacteraceae bacterium]MBV8591013.1 COQ9 family protein [Acetobacteraceae bacterium]